MLHILVTFALASLTSALSCPVVFDGRVPSSADVGLFDRGETPWGGLRPRDVKWSSILDFPGDIPPSMFDRESNSKPVQIGINDNSVLRPSNAPAQTGYRRTEMIFMGNKGNDPSTQGVKTFHWSVGQGRPLNFSHEYLNVFHERNDNKGYQFRVSIGALVGKEKQFNSRAWKVQDRSGNVIFSTPSVEAEWENFAVMLNYMTKYVPVASTFPSLKSAKLTTRSSPQHDQGLLLAEIRSSQTGNGRPPQRQQRRRALPGWLAEEVHRRKGPDQERVPKLEHA
jgi:hypothetical protein